MQNVITNFLIDKRGFDTQAPILNEMQQNMDVGNGAAPAA